MSDASTPKTTDLSAPTDDGAPQSDASTAKMPAISDRFRRVLTWLIFGFITLMTIGLIVSWMTVETPDGPQIPFGRGLLAFITMGFFGLAIILTLFWVICLSRLQWVTVSAIVVAVAMLGATAQSTVRDLEYNGDALPTPHFVWESTQMDRLIAHRASTGPATAETSDADAERLATIESTDKPAYRGINRDGIVDGPPITQNWQQNPPEKLWRQPIGGGYASFAVVGDRAVTIEQRGMNEAVVCYDTATGTEHWVHEYPSFFSEAMGGDGPRATPTIVNGHVYSIGGEGDFHCLDLLTGEVKWSDNILDRFYGKTDRPGKNIEWAMSSSPLIVGETVVVNPGPALPVDFEPPQPSQSGLAAFDLETGELVWVGEGLADATNPKYKNRAGYSSPQLSTIANVEQILIFDGVALRGVDRDTGEQLWHYPFGGSPWVNVAQPVVFDDGRVFISASYNLGAAMLQVTRSGDGKWSVEKVWANNNMRCKFTSPIVQEGFLYGLDEGILVCLDAKTGQRKWKKGRYGHGQILLTRGQLFILSEAGEIVLVNANPNEYEEVTRLDVLDAVKTWNPPTLVRGIAYLRNHEDAVALDLNPTDE